MSSGSKGIPGVWKARTGKNGVETMMPELDKLKEFTISSIGQLRDEEIRMTETMQFSLSKKHLAQICQFQTGVLQLHGVHTETTQPLALSEMGNEYRPKSRKAVPPGIKSRIGSTCGQACRPNTV